MTVIYALCEPGTRTVRYIGKAVNLARRFREHLRVSVRTAGYLGNWLRSLGGAAPALVVLREVPDEAGSDSEIKYIRIARSLGMKLVNATDGGDGGTPTPETRAKMSAALTGRRLSEEARRNVGLAKRGSKNPAFGKRHTPEHSAKIRAAQTGKKHSPEWCAAISAGLTGRAFSPEHCAAISRANAGRKMSPEWIEKIAAAHRGKKLSAAHCAAIGAGRKGRKISEKGRANMRAGWEKRRAASFTL